DAVEDDRLAAVVGVDRCDHGRDHGELEVGCAARLRCLDRSAKRQIKRFLVRGRALAEAALEVVGLASDLYRCGRWAAVDYGRLTADLRDLRRARRRAGASRSGPRHCNGCGEHGDGGENKLHWTPHASPSIWLRCRLEA